MTDKFALEIINKIFKNVFDEDNPYSLEEILSKFAFDIKLPNQVYDSVTNEVTYADSINSGKYITLANMERKDKENSWMLKKREIHDLQELMNI